MRCSAITKGGERCKLEATNGSYCWSHAPGNEEARRRRGRRGGKARGAGELSEIKRAIRQTVDGVLDGSIERGIGAVAFQGFNTLLKSIEVERKIREQEELEARLEELEALMEANKQRGTGWG